MEKDPDFSGLKDFVQHYETPNAKNPTPELWAKFFPNHIYVDHDEIARQEKWHDRWFKRAEELASWSKDPSTKIGVVYVNEETHRELSAGYNGFPRGIKDDERLHDRPTKYKLVVHAEMNGIFNAVNNGITLNGCSMYVWGNAGICSDCAKGIIQVGVKHVYVREELVKAERWRETWSLTQQMFDEAGVYYHLK